MKFEANILITNVKVHVVLLPLKTPTCCFVFLYFSDIQTKIYLIYSHSAKDTRLKINLFHLPKAKSILVSFFVYIICLQLIYFHHQVEDLRHSPKRRLFSQISRKVLSFHHFTSNEALIKFKSHLKVKLYLFYGIQGNRAIYGNWAQIGPKFLWKLGLETQKVIPTPHLTSSEALLKRRGHLRFAFYLFQCIQGIKAVWGNWA